MSSSFPRKITSPVWVRERCGGEILRALVIAFKSLPFKRAPSGVTAMRKNNCALVLVFVLAFILLIAAPKNAHAQGKGKGMPDAAGKLPEKVADPLDAAASKKDIAAFQAAILSEMRANEKSAQKRHTEVMGKLDTVVRQGKTTVTLLEAVVENQGKILGAVQENGKKLVKLDEKVEKWRKEDAERFRVYLEQNDLLQKKNEGLEAYKVRAIKRIAELEGEVACLQAAPPKTVVEYRNLYRTVEVPRYVYVPADNSWYGYGPCGSRYRWGYSAGYYGNTYPVYAYGGYPYWYGSHYGYYQRSYWYYSA